MCAQTRSVCLFKLDIELLNMWGETSSTCDMVFGVVNVSLNKFAYDKEHRLKLV